MQAVSVCDGHGERCPIKSHHARPIADHEGAGGAAALMRQCPLLQPAVEAVIAAIEGSGSVLGLQGLGRLQGHQLCQGLGAAMVRCSCSLAWGGASSAASKRSNGSAPTLSQVCLMSSFWAAKRAVCSTKSVRVRPEALTARSIRA